ncbi:hypothetical protein WJX73_007566 [Symbiochloris irregularis]|uniref:phosphoribosylformylglycinamidine synthase n=1 Tax=Symbiochloris irregularis TaxID=706552 RepID=A0AAW1NSN8_9CHLO
MALAIRGAFLVERSCPQERRTPCLAPGPSGLPASTRSSCAASKSYSLRGRQLPISYAVAAPEEAAAASTSAPLQQQGASVFQLHRYPGLSASAATALLTKGRQTVSQKLTEIVSEQCFNIAISQPLNAEETDKLSWLLRETFEPDMLTAQSRFESALNGSQPVVEVGPRMSFTTAWSANAVSICAACGLSKVTRIEPSRRYQLHSSQPLSEADIARFAVMVHDRMTEEVYPAPLTSFATNVVPDPVYTVPVMAEGQAALEHINEELGLAFDDWDLKFYTKLFKETLGRDPTNVELFDMAQSNSEHSRHWFFRAQLILDGQAAPHTLMKLVKEPLDANPRNSVIGFHDNSSAMRGTKVKALLPSQCAAPGDLALQERDWDILLTAETHNFPCAVAPYPGAETGAGGRMRDTHATGIGSMMGVATAGYCVGNLYLDGSHLPGEDPSFAYPGSLAPPLQVLIDASNGASDYGNKFGEPLVAGYTRTFGMRMPDGSRREWIKPIMFSGGLGQIDHHHLAKAPPQVGWLVVKIGGPAYRIGMGGGAASSLAGGSNKADLDFNAVQRGDAEMAQKLWRVVRACVELGPDNPIQQIHDQGAGGNCNVVKEIIYPLGAEIDIRAVRVGDDTLSVMEIWGAEYQENDCLLIKPEARQLLQSICDRERTFLQVIGAVSGDGRVVVRDSRAPPDSPFPVDLDLEHVLGDMPNKTFEFKRLTVSPQELQLPRDEVPLVALEKVLRLPAVGSKRFLTTKVDRCVTGLVAQQQCCGPLQLPVADVAVMAQSHFVLTGAATAIGEAPIKGLLNPAAMARLALGESLTNLVWAAATHIADIKASVNWMYAAKMEGEGAAMYDAAEALKDAMLQLGLACDGGKDSVSMVASVADEAVKAPGNLVVSSYVTCPDITLTVTPDLKLPGRGVLLHVDLAQGRRRLGGSALAQAYDQVGKESPDVDIPLLGRAFEVTQALLRQRLISSGHDISDGGIVTALLEMAFAGNCGIEVDLPLPAADNTAHMGTLFAEELGLILEVAPTQRSAVLAAYKDAGVLASVIGKVTAEAEVQVNVGGQFELSGSTAYLRDVWESTGFQLERLQANEATVAEEQDALAERTAPRWHIPFTPSFAPRGCLDSPNKPRVAVIREEGSNGDREMSAAVYMAGLQPCDITMSDLLAERASLDGFQGLVFVGGFSYADVLDSAKGWAGTIRHNARLWNSFLAFYQRPDTFSLGVCNGCQLMALLGWVPGGLGDLPGGLLPDIRQPRFVHNTSERFESRWSHVIVQPSSAVLLKDMEGSQIGIWCAHGEGRAVFPDPAVFTQVVDQQLAPIRYCDADGIATESYPQNPNGSPQGIAALCSADGRHLAMMPHPERCFLGWQHPHKPPSVQANGAGPWLQLFHNAREWCAAHAK